MNRSLLIIALVNSIVLCCADDLPRKIVGRTILGNNTVKFGLVETNAGFDLEVRVGEPVERGPKPFSKGLQAWLLRTDGGCVRQESGDGGPMFFEHLRYRTSVWRFRFAEASIHDLAGVVVLWNGKLVSFEIERSDGPKTGANSGKPMSRQWTRPATHD